MPENNENDPLPNGPHHHGKGETSNEEPLELFDFIDESDPANEGVQPASAAKPPTEVEQFDALDFFDHGEVSPPQAFPIFAEAAPVEVVEDPMELLDFLEEAEAPAPSERTDITHPVVPAGFDNNTWAEISFDELPQGHAASAEQTEFLDLDSDIFAAERTELEMPASAVNLIHPNVEPTLDQNDGESDSGVAIDVAPPMETDEPLTAAKLYGIDDTSDHAHGIPMAEPIEFGNGAEEIDFDVLHAGDSSSSLYSNSGSPPDASGVQLGEIPSAVDSASSIFGDDPQLLPTSPGSGWFDTPRSGKYALPSQVPPPSSRTDIGRTEPPRSGGSIADLFGMLAHGPATPNVSVSSGWVKDDKTGNISESEVLKAFDQLAKPTSKNIPVAPATAAGHGHNPPESGPDFNRVDLEGAGSNLFSQPDAENGPSGVDILEGHPLQDTGGSQSSIFSNAPKAESPSDLASSEQITFNEEIDFEDSQHSLFGGSAIVGSSIFEKGTSEKALWEAAEEATEAELPHLSEALPNDRELASHAAIESGLDWGDESKAVEAGIDWDAAPADADQVSMYMPKPDSLSEIDELFFPSGPTSPSIKPEYEILPPESSSNFVGVVGSASAAESGIIHGPSSEIYRSGTASGIRSVKDEEPTAKKPKKKSEVPAKRKSSVGGWIGGGVAGLLLGAGGVGGAYMAGLLPSSDGEKLSLSPVAKADPKMAEELKIAIAKLQETEKKAADDSEAVSAKLRESGEVYNKLKDEFDEAKALATKAQTELKTAMAATTKAQDDLKIAMADTDKAKDDTKLAKADAEKAGKDLIDAKKAQTEAETLAADTEKKRKATDDALAGIVKEMKASKLIPDDDEPAVAIAKVPEVLKNAAIAMTSADAKKAAEALGMAKKEIESLKLAMTKAEESLTLAKAETKDAITAAKKAEADAAKMVADAKKETDDKVAAAIEKTAADSKKKLQDAAVAVAAAEAKLKADSVAHETQLKALAETHAKQMLDARAGGGIELTTAEARTLDKSFAAYGKGVNAYHAKNFSGAEKALSEATTDFASDARYWYFLGLAQYQQGKTADAEASFKKGADLEKRNLPGRAVINEDLQRIQGTLRLELAKFRP